MLIPAIVCVIAFIVIVRVVKPLIFKQHDLPTEDTLEMKKAIADAIRERGEAMNVQITDDTNADGNIMRTISLNIADDVKTQHAIEVVQREILRSLNQLGLQCRRITVIPHSSLQTAAAFSEAFEEKIRTHRQVIDMQHSKRELVLQPVVTEK